MSLCSNNIYYNEYLPERITKGLGIWCKIERNRLGVTQEEL